MRAAKRALVGLSVATTIPRGKPALELPINPEGEIWEWVSAIVTWIPYEAQTEECSRAIASDLKYLTTVYTREQPGELWVREHCQHFIFA